MILNLFQAPAFPPSPLLIRSTLLFDLPEGGNDSDEWLTSCQELVSRQIPEKTRCGTQEHTNKTASKNTQKTNRKQW